MMMFKQVAQSDLADAARFINKGLSADATDALEAAKDALRILATHQKPEILPRIEAVTVDPDAATLRQLQQLAQLF